MTFTVIFSILLLAAFVIAFWGSGKYWRLVEKNNELERRNLQLESHNRYLVARYGVEQPRAEASNVKVLSNGGSLSLPNPKVKNVKVVRQVDPENYYDGIVEPQQYLDMELEWNKSNNTSKS